ncbi:Na+-dependent transporter [Mesorhizobium sp. M6A.T.Ce.TU.016.01.1.1]|uniref:bile acid:sodium symporter family protein n=1 Tax=Mesorhizobium sp. M6A.T.Ce.TU.016.01.1.1 TaxID=2496783 RepID=UPI000FCC4351|nr:Na+-dependent transporter [Mesorhizobium sp. M6A.T.Ce.TU.016.01.1.1]RUU28323.1 Na+-dependent transporter [Mesorhizobium sp. M6A.T.Ce.TU.016.01.1.1]
MTLAQVIPMAINLSMGLMVLALGLHATWSDATSLVRNPGLLIRSFVSMNVLMTIVAVIMALVFNLHPAVKLALVALALSPVPPILPGKQTKAGGTTSYTASLLASMAVLSIVIVPLGMALISQAFDLGVSVPSGKIASIVFIGIIVPLGIGLLIRQFAPILAAKIDRPLSLFATVLLIVAFIPVLIKIWPQLMAMVGNGTLVALVVFALIGVAVGHWLGGPVSDDRTVLALATSARHPGVAMAIAAAAFPEERAVIAVVLWHLIVSAIVCIPYVKRRTNLHKASQAEAP